MWSGRRGAGRPVLRQSRVRRSWDSHPVAVQAGHRPAQAHRRQTALPKAAEVHRPAQLRKAAAQEQGEPVATVIQPPPPAPRRPAVQPHPAGAAVQRAAGQQQLQNQLLDCPAIPSPRRDALRQARTRPSAATAEITGDRDGVQRSGGMRAPVRLALVTAVAPKTAQPAMRAGRRPVDLGGVGQHVEML